MALLVVLRVLVDMGRGRSANQWRNRALIAQGERGTIFGYYTSWIWLALAVGLPMGLLFRWLIAV